MRRQAYIFALLVAAVLVFVVVSGCTSSGGPSGNPATATPGLSASPPANAPKTAMDVMFGNSSYVYNLHYIKMNDTLITSPSDYYTLIMTYGNDVTTYNGTKANHISFSTYISGGEGPSYEQIDSSLANFSMDMYLVLVNGVVTNILGGHLSVMGEDEDFGNIADFQSVSGMNLSQMLDAEGVNGFSGMMGFAEGLNSTDLESNSNVLLDYKGIQTITIGDKKYDCYVFNYTVPASDSDETNTTVTFWWSPLLPGIPLKTVDAALDNGTAIETVEDWRQ